MSSSHILNQFLSLPNELISHIFKYLSAADLIESFGDLPNYRLQQLFAFRISLMNLKITAAEPLVWINQYRTIVQQYVKRVVIDIEFAENILYIMPKLDALTIIYDYETEYYLNCFVAHFQTVADVHVGTLTLSTYDGGLNTNITNLLLNGNGQFPEHTLNVSDCRLALNIHDLPSHCQLRHLNCIVQEEAFLHALLACLPNLETIKVGLISNGLELESDIFMNAKFVGVSTETDADSDVQDHVVLSRYIPKKDTPNIIVVAPPYLRYISITGDIANFDLLSQLFQLGSKSLKIIKLKVYAYSIIDPEQMDRVDNHINFDFSIDYQLLQLPADFDWKSYIDAFSHRPVLRCEEKRFCCLSSTINKTVFWLQTPKIFVTSPQALCFPQVSV
ncbi:unnamed protein product [Adineta steineri]|uniref:F-box domain-containing protein n=1 Tax=Adineta steineri TaxID=433720 RepID=A0A814R2W0_9BILA|nr:unnamed protein product [Adineta steineri]CAF1469176.1 unnamed protein product [Adineta steineri]